MAMGTEPDAMRWASPSAMAVFPTPAAPTSAGLFLPCRRRMSMVRAISSSRQRTCSSRPARASAVRARVNRARAPESMRSEWKESSIIAGMRGCGNEGMRTPRRRGRKEHARYQPRQALLRCVRSASRCGFLPQWRAFGCAPLARSVGREEDAAEEALAPDEHHDGGRSEEDAEGDEREPQLIRRRVKCELGLARAPA